MLSDIPKVQLNLGDKAAATKSGIAPKDDVVVSKRELRSSKPEVVYHLSPPNSSYTSTPIRPLSRPILQQPVSGGPVIRPSAPVFPDTIPLLSPVGYPVHPPPQPSPPLPQLHPLQQSPPLPQLVFDEAVDESDNSIDNSIDSDIDDSFEMAETSILAPPVFSGRSDQDPENF